MLRDSIAKFFKVDNLISNLTGYVETRLELVKVEAKEELAKGLSKVLIVAALAFLFSLFVVFLSIGVALSLADVWGDLAAFAIVAGFYFLLGIILFLSRKSVGGKLERYLNDVLNKKKD